MNETIETLDKLLTMVEVEILNLARLVEEKTDGKLSMCNGTPSDHRFQMHSRIPASEALEILKEWADDAALETRWSDAQATCYYFNIDRHPFCIVLDKEDIDDR